MTFNLGTGGSGAVSGRISSMFGDSGKVGIDGGVDDDGGGCEKYNNDDEFADGDDGGGKLDGML